MKTLSLLALSLVIACSSAEKKKQPESETVKADTFKKERPLKSADVADYYTGNQNALSPALQDETLDRYTNEEIEQMAETQDPLMDIAIRCSKGDYKNAFAMASKSFDRYQKVPTYWNLVANCHLQQGGYRKALLFYNKALEVKPNYVPALNNIGVMYSRQGQDQKALIAFERANKQSRFAKTPRYNLAKLYLTYGLADLALPLFEGLLGEAPNDVDLLNAIAAGHFIKGDHQAALNTYQKIPRAHWARPEIGLNISLALKSAGRNDDALKIFESIERPKSEALKRYYADVQKHIGEK